MWTEQTVINPSAWNRRVEADLRQHLYARFASETPTDEAIRHANAHQGRGGWTTDELAAAAQFEDALRSCFQSASSQLAEAEHVPYVVTFNGDGTASLSTADLNELADDERVRWQNPIKGGATAPAFASTPNVGSGLVSATLDTSLTAPTNVTTIVTGGSSGTKVEELIVQGVGTTVAAVVNVFLHDGSTYNLYDQVLISAVTSSTTAVAFRALRQYTNCLVKNGWTLKVTNTVAGNQSLIKVTGTGGDL